MNEYEITYLSNPTLSEDKRGELDVAIDSAIADSKGSIDSSESQTRRRMAYPLENNVNTSLRTIQAKIDPSKIEELRNLIRKLDGITRVSILKTSLRTAAPDLEKRAAEAAAKEAEDTPTKEVTMEDVEKGIEDALEEEVK